MGLLTDEKCTPVLYLDIDGTVRHGYDELGRFVNGPDDVVIFPEAVEMMRRWKAGGGRIIGVSNQGGIALGHLTHDACVKAMQRTHELSGRLFDKIAWCATAPDSVESSHGYEGVFILSPEKTNRDFPGRKEDEGRVSPLVSTVRHRVCAQTARSSSKETGPQDPVSSAGIPTADGCCSAWLLSRHLRWRRNPRSIQEGGQDHSCLSGCSDYDRRASDQMVRPIRGHSDRTPAADVTTRETKQKTVEVEALRNLQHQTPPRVGNALLDCQANQSRTGSHLYSWPPWLLGWVNSFAHHPQADHPEMARCWCRKPSPGLLIEASLSLAERCRGEIYPPYMSVMVGDQPEDAECARIASIDFQWAAEWRAQALVTA